MLASSNCLFIFVEISFASNALALFVASTPSATDPKVLPLSILFAPFINLATPTPRVPAPTDIPAVFKPS